jgi:hypothetical protein
MKLDDVEVDYSLPEIIMEIETLSDFNKAIAEYSEKFKSADKRPPVKIITKAGTHIESPIKIELDTFTMDMDLNHQGETEELSMNLPSSMVGRRWKCTFEEIV